MVAKSPEHVVELLDRAFNAKDIDGVLSFYEDNAVVVIEPGRLARGQSELRAFFEGVMASQVSAAQLKTHVMEADGVALFISRWVLRVSEHGEDTERRFVATTVFRRQADGGWKALIDNSLGPLVLGPEV
ncbi:MAG: nuclear transport factor 2 family protein [Acidobacteriaceae bacterium]